MKEQIKNKLVWIRKNPRQAALKALPIVVPMFAAMFMFVAVSPSFAQEVQLEIDTTAMTTDLFRGANIIIAALGAVMFLLAGFKLGGILIRGIVDAIGGIRF